MRPRMLALLWGWCIAALCWALGYTAQLGNPVELIEVANYMLLWMHFGMAFMAAFWFSLLDLGILGWLLKPRYPRLPSLEELGIKLQEISLEEESKQSPSESP